MDDKLEEPVSGVLPGPLARLVADAARVQVATAENATDASHLPIQDFLAQVRTVFRMDVAFVSEFAQDRRIFRVVSSAAETPAIRAGDADPMLDTYCKMVVDGRLDRCVPDTSVSPAAGLAVTTRLRIGAYLAATIRLPEGAVFGTLCCYSHSSRPDLQQRDADVLQVLADAVAASIGRQGELRRPVWLGGPQPGT
jgi:GAF domain-containing protein